MTKPEADKKKSAATPVETRESDVAPYRQCPLCRGKGNAYSSTRRKRYYRCAHCAHTWVAVITPAIVHNIRA